MDLEDFLIIDSNKISYERYESLLDALSNNDALRMVHKIVTCTHVERNQAIDILYDFLEQELQSQMDVYTKEEDGQEYERDDDVWL